MQADFDDLKKGRPANRPASYYKYGCRLTATRRRTAAAARANRYFGCNPEAGTRPVGDIIYCNVLGFFVKILIDQHCKAVYFIHVICFFWFVQNHRQGWTRSAPGLEKDPDRSDLFFLEIILQNFFGLF